MKAINKSGLVKYVNARTYPWFFVVILILSLLFAGCATLEAVSKAKQGSPKIYSGTRLDAHAINQNSEYLKNIKLEYGISPPEHPWIDMPFSIVLDTAFFPLTSSVALYELIFEPDH